MSTMSSFSLDKQTVARTDPLHPMAKVNLGFYTALVAFVERRPTASTVELGLYRVLHRVRQHRDEHAHA
eukprot:9326687-Pyramimonas_sp.AAC.1